MDMKLNLKIPSIFTHEGGKAKHISPEFQLKRSVMGCLLWEDTFYESGETVSDRIKALVPQVPAGYISALAIEARNKMKLRHVPLLLAREMARYEEHKKFVKTTLHHIIQRPDELTEFLAIYWKEKKQPLSAQAKKGLALAFTKFDEYALAKYNQDGKIKLRDVLFLCHPKPKDLEQAVLWRKLVEDKLETPDTWEVKLSAGEGKKTQKEKRADWEILLREKKIGGLALIRNLRNMQEALVDEALIKQSLNEMRTDRILPYRFIAAARFAPQLEPELEAAMFKCLKESEKLKGRTSLLIDVSGSMDDKLSSKSDLTRLDAACGLAMLLREVGEDVRINTFSSGMVGIPPRRGFALRDAIIGSQPHGGTQLGAAIGVLLGQTFERLIVITDEQTEDKVPDPNPIWKHSYMINVASNKNGVGYGKYHHIDGFSEAILNYIKWMEMFHVEH